MAEGKVNSTFCLLPFLHMPSRNPSTCDLANDLQMPLTQQGKEACLMFSWVIIQLSHAVLEGDLEGFFILTTCTYKLFERHNSLLVFSGF